MTARRRILPDAGPLTGTAATAAAGDRCARRGCGHTRIRHPAAGPCLVLDYEHDNTRPGSVLHGTPMCGCPGYLESEE